MKFARRVIVLLCFLYVASAAADVKKSAAAAEANQDCTDVARGEQTLMVFSTLGGGLTAVDPITSEIRWTIADEPAVQADSQQNMKLPHYLPDPRDGSIYQLGNRGDLKKLPYTIPQLVASAPCRSSDGILYSGKKSDTWFLVDPKTGKREKVLGFGNVDSNPTESVGWATSRSIYLGRTQYTVMMYDSLAKDKNVKPWNITFYDYTSHTMAPEISSEYEYIHLAGSSSGLVATLDRKFGKLIWQKDLTSPVVAVFLLGAEGLLSVPFTTVSDEALRSILLEADEGSINQMKLFQSLYIGEHKNGLYALPSLVDKNTATISSDPPVKLLGGPHAAQPNYEKNVIYFNNLLEDEKNAIVFGHYDVPQVDNTNFNILPTNTKQIENNELSTIINKAAGIFPTKQTSDMGIQTEPEVVLVPNIVDHPANISLLDRKQISKFLNASRAWFIEHPSGTTNQLMIILFVIIVMMFWYFMSTVRELKSQSQNGSKTMNRSSGSSTISCEDLLELGNGDIKVGKITFNSTHVLGKGCEGTFVFRGTFEERDVAVKRLLPECFTFADREVALLRESDAHENVVRYFCTEQDRQFRYIAVELCAATLQDYTEGEKSTHLQSQIKVWDVLKQATSGLAHLHSLNIVHRDIKPQNVLLSFPDAGKNVKIMISDFGLCKKLNYGKASFSRRSGITGTEGWIAPEMIRGQRTTTSVDMFSLGCVFYYVLTKGNHPYGDTLKRQANILTHEYDLCKLKENIKELESRMILSHELISDMIHKDPQRRPPSKAIKNHPVFWDENRILAFLQDVSDRVEKLQFEVEPLKTLERNGRFVVREDWNLQLDESITSDLRKYRGYMGASVRDLLRAFRNKKHHYHELSAEAQDILGSIPREFTGYWIRKFPHLISHAYHALSICSNESPFKPYYGGNYQFTRPSYFDPSFVDANPLFVDPKPLQKCTSPKKPQTDKYTAKQKKGSYNFRNGNEGNENDSVEDSSESPKRDIFANFKIRNRNNRSKKSNSTDQHVTWVIPEKNETKDN